MLGYLKCNWKVFFIFAILYCIFIKTSTSDDIMDETDLKIDNITIKCILLDDRKNYIEESIERSSFLYKLLIYGVVISFTDIPDDTFCPGDVVIIEMFAVDKIIIDDDFDALGETVTFILAAPTWDVVDERQINLRGHDAGEHGRPSADNGRRNGNRNGFHGRPGKPGGAGGHFHGIALDVNNMENLAIKVEGGNGGHGQNGGNGVSGITGTTFDLSKDKIKRNGTVKGFKVILQRKLQPPENETNLGEGIQEVVLGQKGTNGGHGGDGGVGGSGGYPGIYAYLNLLNNGTDKNSVFQAVDPGKAGRDGKGGRGGEAGHPGSDIVLDLFFSKGDEVLIRNADYYEQQELLSGSNGLSGKSVEGEEMVKEHPHLQTFMFTFYRYQRFLLINKDMASDVKKMEDVVIGNVNRLLSKVNLVLSLIE